MPHSLDTGSGLLELISSAVAPVALITTTAILLSGYTSKYVSLASQMRGLTAECRSPDIHPERRENLRRQLIAFKKRSWANWAASACLYIALICFLCTVFAVVFSVRLERLDRVGAVTVIAGLACILGAVGLELYDLYLARLTMALELEDAFEPAVEVRKDPDRPVA